MIDITVRVVIEPVERRIGKVTTRPAVRVTHKYARNANGNIEIDENGDKIIVANRYYIPGLKNYIQWYSDGTYTGIGAMWDELQPHQRSDIV